LRAYLARHGVPFVDDPTNEDMTRDRPRIRAALPVLEDLGITAEAILQSAYSLSMARLALDHYTRAEAERIVTIDRGDVLIAPNPTPSVPADILRRLRLSALRWVGRDPYPPRHMAEGQLDLGLLQAGKHTLAGCIITQKDNVLRITREFNAVRDLTCPTTEVWDGRWALDGPHAPDLHIGALGAAVKECPDWRATGLPRASLIASPAVWRGDMLVAAPLAGVQNGWTARIVADFHTVLVGH
jgi:tRNA(Ile)-lysidine synthase